VRGKTSFNAPPTAGGGIARAAYALALDARLDVAPLLKGADLTVQQARNARVRVAVRNQVKFLNRVADALRDEFLGIRLAQSLDLRELGLLYYVLASSETLGDALQRVARYSAIHNEGVHITYSERKELTLTFEYVGVSRLSDRHQIEFFVATVLRICRQLSGRHLSPSGVRLKHRRLKLPTGMRAFFGCDVEFGCHVDRIAYPKLARSMPIVNSDPYLNSLMVGYCEEALAKRRVRSGGWRLRVENAIAPLLPHGAASMAEVARRLAVGQRTLARRLASEGFTFAGILDSLRSDLARRYLREPDLPISEIAWLLGYRESSAFNHAFKRWTGTAPKQARLAGAMSAEAAGLH
jgi:AraC-like DNA-binding protein